MGEGDTPYGREVVPASMRRRRIRTDGTSSVTFALEWPRTVCSVFVIQASESPYPITYPISYAGKRLHTHRRAGSWIRRKRSETLKYRRFRGNKKGSGIIPEPSMAESEGFEPSSRNQRLTP